MDKRIIEHILKWDYESDLDFITLLDFIDKNNIPVVDSRLINILGMATFYQIHLDIDYLEYQPYKLRYFIILHEIAHYKRLHKKGLDFHLTNLSNSNIDELYNHILLEETIADKYGMFVYRKLTDDIYPYEMTQCINENKLKLMDTAKSFIGVLDNNEDSYKAMIQKYIII